MTQELAAARALCDLPAVERIFRMYAAMSDEDRRAMSEWASRGCRKLPGGEARPVGPVLDAKEVASRIAERVLKPE